MQSLVFSNTAQTTNNNFFALQPNTSKLGARRIILFFVIVIFPTLFSAAAFFQLFNISGWGLSARVLGVGLGLYLLYQFIVNAQKQYANFELSFEDNQVKLFKDNEITAQANIDDLKVTFVNWGIDDNQLMPAISLMALNGSFPRVCIGASQPCEKWKHQEKCIDFTDFTLASEDEWKKLSQIFKAY